jgi:hypothetical protein
MLARYWLVGVNPTIGAPCQQCKFTSMPGFYNIAFAQSGQRSIGRVEVLAAVPEPPAPPIAMVALAIRAAAYTSVVRALPRWRNW